MKRTLTAWCVFLSLMAHAQQPTKTYETLVAKGYEAMAHDSISTAIRIFEEAVAEMPHFKTNGHLYLHIGNMEQAQGKLDAALMAYNKGMEDDDQLTELYLRRGELYLLMDEPQRAVRDLSVVIDRQTNPLEARYYRGYAHYQLRHYTEARIDYTFVQQHDVTDTKSALGLVMVNEADGRGSEAMRQMNQLVAREPENALFLATRADMERQRKQYELAEYDINKAIQLEPNNPDYYLLRAQIYTDTKRKQKAQTDLREAKKRGQNVKMK